MATMLTSGRVRHPARCACAATSPKPEIAPRSIIFEPENPSDGTSDVGLRQTFEFRSVFVRAESARDQRDHETSDAERRVLAEFVLHLRALVADRPHHGEIEPGVVAPGLVALLAQLRGRRLHLVDADPNRAPSVAPLGDALERVLVAA